jgi:trehalose transport system substrate-binding protein
VGVVKGRWHAVGALLATVALVATACGGEPQTTEEGEGGLSGTTITFNVSLAPEEQAGVQEVVDAFQQETGATVRLSSVTAEDMPSKLQVEVDSGNNTIHLISMDNNSLAALVDGGFVQEVDDVPVPGEVSEALIPPTFDGKTFFLPFRPNVRVAYFNKEQTSAAGVSGPPATIEEYRAAAEAFAETAGEPKVTVSLAEGTSAPVVLSEWVLSFGGDPVILNDEGSVEALTYLQELWNDNLLAQESLQGQFDTEVDNLSGEVAWYAQNWPFTSGVFAEQGVLDLFEIHQGWAGPAGEFHVIGGDVLGIPTGVEGNEREAAVALAEFLMTRESQSTLAATNAWPSIRGDATQDVPEELQGTFDAIQAALEHGWYRPSVAYWPDVQTAMDEVVRRVLQEGEDVQTVLDEAHAQIQEAAEASGAPYPPES